MIRVLAGVGLLLVAGCGEAQPLPVKATVTPRPPILAAEIADMQAVADDACRCQRTSPDDTSCWKTFEARTAPHPDSAQLASACAPISTEQTCFHHDNPDARFCITTARNLVGTGRRLCSAQEARIVDATFTATLKETGDDYEQATTAAIKAADDLIRGKAVFAPAAEGGCTG